MQADNSYKELGMRNAERRMRKLKVKCLVDIRRGFFVE